MAFCIRKSPLSNCIWLSGLLALLVWCAPAAAEDYKELPAPTEAKTYSKVQTYLGRKEVEEMLRGNATFDAKAFDKFYNELLFPHFTRSENFQDFVHRVDLPRMRRILKSDFNVAKTGAVHEHLNELVLTFMDGIAQDNYHPAARASAMMMIADLSETDPNGKPWKNALPALLKGVTAQTTTDAVRVPALRGLLRHAQAGIDSQARPQVIATMLEVLGQRTPPENRTADGHDWIRRRAIDVLVAIGEPGENGAVADALAKVIEDNAASVSIRSAAAAALANPKLTPPKNFDAMTLAKSVGA